MQDWEWGYVPEHTRNSLNSNVMYAEILLQLVKKNSNFKCTETGIHRFHITNYYRKSIYFFKYPSHNYKLPENRKENFDKM